MRIRISFSKSGPLIYIGNLDLYTMWERAARRARIPLAYSQGFHPQPKIHFAAPLPLGYSSRCEILDMRLNQGEDLATLCPRLNEALPAGIRVLDVQEIDESAPAVQTQVLFADYQVELGGRIDLNSLQGQVDALLVTNSLPRTRRERQYDLRPLIESVSVRKPTDGKGAILDMRLKAQEGATGRPDEVLLSLGIDREGAHIERTALHLRDQPSTAS